MKTSRVRQLARCGSSSALYCAMPLALGGSGVKTATRVMRRRPGPSGGRGTRGEGRGAKGEGRSPPSGSSLAVGLVRARGGSQLLLQGRDPGAQVGDLAREVAL